MHGTLRSTFPVKDSLIAEPDEKVCSLDEAGIVPRAPGVDLFVSAHYGFSSPYESLRLFLVTGACMNDPKKMQEFTDVERSQGHPGRRGLGGQGSFWGPPRGS